MTSQNFTGASHRGETRSIVLDNSRDELLTAFGKATLTDRYLLPGETYQSMFGRVACAYSEHNAHAQRVYDAISKLWFMPSTPILSNGGTERGLPISCFLNTVEDSLEGIEGTWSENVWLAARGGGIGTCWSEVRSIGEKIGEVGESSGIIPFIKVQDSLTLGISQGSLRRGSAAVYLDVSHPEIMEFLEIRDPNGGDQNRRSLNIHHGVTIPDAFMEAVRNGHDWELKSPATGDVRKTVEAREVWEKIMAMRIKTGEPYLLFTDTVNRALPEHQKRLGLRVTQSNLCSEITLPTGLDHIGGDRTAVCCLSSLNVETYLEWKGNRQFLKDVCLFLDEVLQSFISRTAGVKGFHKARYAAYRERSIGLGMMGFQSLLQSMSIAMESAMAKVWNRQIWRWLSETGAEINAEVAAERGPCPDAQEGGAMKRWSHIYSIAPTASISIIAGNTSPCGEPHPTNIFTQKTLSGSHTVKNRHLQALLEKKWTETGWKKEADDKETWIADQWSQILNDEGSVQNLAYLNEHEKMVFMTAFEIDQRWLLEHMVDRAPFICQAASNNFFVPPDVNVWDMHNLHFKAWERGVKSLYYLRSKSAQRATKITHLAGEMPVVEQAQKASDYDECLVCQ